MACCSAKTFALIFGVLDMVFSSIFALGILVFFSAKIGMLSGILAQDDISTLLRMETGQTLGVMVGLCIALLLLCIGKFYLGLTLWKGADKNDYRKCRVWLIATAIMLVLNVVVSVGVNPATWRNMVGAVIYETFRMVVVFQLIQKIQSGDYGTKTMVKKNVAAATRDDAEIMRKFVIDGAEKV